MVHVPSIKLKSKAASILFVGLAMALTFGLVAPRPAHAAYSDCPANALCLWKDYDGNGARLTFMGPFAVRGSCQNLTTYAGWNDVVSSWKNNLSYGAMSIMSVNCPNNSPGAEYWPLPAGGQGNFPWYPDNDVSSIRFN